MPGPIARVAILTLTIATLSGCAISAQQRRSDYVESNPTTSFSGPILNGQIAVGMTKQEVLASWGAPCGWCYGTRTTSDGEWWEYNVFGTGSFGAGAGTHLFFNAQGKLQYWSK